ncbi:alcohol dehydrogenase IV [Protomyces lactucae-debilis]|uniref:Alcohol dehydrogenase IV n=1 Tax=Protomyces lactucae-debilis TaxID=2754530 RepID=A0A1Y2FA07_PROLT|nr:alcohol dehydrogenase IV [Protomyces lactucae-debilis]ORY80467.1 alcohol dehydrogenase IV [Protomyces lactucae-debilis]
MASTDLVGSYSFTKTQTIQYGPNCIKDVLPALFDRLQVKKAFIVTGNSLKTKTEVIKQIEGLLGDRHAGTSTKISQHTPEEGIRETLKAMADANADVLLSVGGGSPIDACKAIAYFHHEESGHWLKHIAVPTTLSAAEFTRNAGYTRKGKKVGVNHPQLAPDAVILDGALTLSTPLRLWLSTGMRALDHAVECQTRTYTPPPIRSLGLAAIQKFFHLLPACKADPDNVEIRQRLQIAAWESMFPFLQEESKQSGFGLSHALGYMLGSPYGIPHGITSCLTLATVVRWQADHASVENKHRLAQILLLLNEKRLGSVEDDVKRVAELIDGLVDTLELRSGLVEAGMPREDLDMVIEGAGLKDQDKADMAKLLQARL